MISCYYNYFSIIKKPHATKLKEGLHVSIVLFKQTCKQLVSLRDFIIVAKGCDMVLGRPTFFKEN